MAPTQVAPTDDCDDADAGAGFSPGSPLGLAYDDIGPELPERTAYLTFDDGPSEWTDEFLEVLRDHQVHATFFVTGKQFKGELGLQGSYVDRQGNTQLFESLLKRTLDEGHVIGNHTVDHPDLALLSDDQIEAEIAQNELEVNEALVRTRSKPVILSLFRPPTGSPWHIGPSEEVALVSERPRVGQRIAHHGLNVLWNIASSDADDWAEDESYSRTKLQPPSENAPTFAAKTSRIKRAVLSDSIVVRGGGFIVLMHDTHPTTLEALPEIIDSLRTAGYSFATVEDLVLRLWQRRSFLLTPGPSLYARCVPQRDWGCVSTGRRDLQGEPLEVCGRMWSAYEALGGASRLGNPVARPQSDPMSGIWSQTFERGTVELHPENPAPCNALLRGP